MSALPSKREFLNANVDSATGKPYAGLTRGRFSAAAEAFAAANTDKWAEAAPVVKAPKPLTVVKAERQAQRRADAAPKVTASTVQAALRPAVDPKAVRAWAKQNGHEVGERGRIHGDVVSAFLAAGGKVTAPAAAPVRPTPAVMPKVRREQSGFTVIGGTLIRQDRCGNGHDVSRCTCTGGVPAYKWLAKEHGAPLMLTLDKPAL